MREGGGTTLGRCRTEPDTRGGAGFPKRLGRRQEADPARSLKVRCWEG